MSKGTDMFREALDEDNKRRDRVSQLAGQLDMIEVLYDKLQVISHENHHRALVAERQLAKVHALGDYCVRTESIHLDAINIDLVTEIRLKLESIMGRTYG